MLIPHAEEKSHEPGSHPHPSLCHGNGNGQVHIRLATDNDREEIYRVRHEVYACELHQHGPNASGRLTDALDTFNTYIVAASGDRLAGFVSVTPPGGSSYSIDKYFARRSLPFEVDDQLYEIRLLTVRQAERRNLLALALMYAAFRWIEAAGGSRIVAIGRSDLVDMYKRVGLTPVGLSARAGQVEYKLMQASTTNIQTALGGIRHLLNRIEDGMSWEIGVPYHTPGVCYHGGDFFSAVGEDFESLDRLESVISADVLDAWFPPAPAVLEALQRHLPRLLQTSPPTGCEGLVRAIAKARGVTPDCILPGGGSSDLIFLALREWLGRGSRVLVLDPTYGEYLHILDKVIRCRADRLPLVRAENYRVPLVRLSEKLQAGYELVVLVNPNSPTGQHIPIQELLPILEAAPAATRIWVDETYVEYAGPGQSLEKFAAASPNVIVCKSMSKTFALSGARAAYLCASPQQLDPLRPLNPPWCVSLPAQVAAVRALGEPEYYAARYRETAALRRQLEAGLRELGWEPVPSTTNFLLCHLPENGPDAATIIARCRQRGLFLRDVSSMGSGLGFHTLRIAVKAAPTTRRMLEILKDVLSG